MVIIPSIPVSWSEQSLRAMTINVARQFRQERRLGSIEVGKIANMTVFNLLKKQND